jgi:hypothetical protein
MRPAEAASDQQGGRHMIIKYILIIFCIMVICADVFLIRAVLEMESNIYDIKGFYKELYQLQKEQCESAFDKWGETIEAFDKSVKLNTEILEGITYKKPMSKAEATELMGKLNLARKAE